MKIKSLKFRKRILALVSLKIIHTLGYLKFQLTEITAKVAPSGAAFVSLNLKFFRYSKYNILTPLQTSGRKTIQHLHEICTLTQNRSFTRYFQAFTRYVNVHIICQKHLVFLPNYLLTLSTTFPTYTNRKQIVFFLQPLTVLVFSEG